MSIFRPNRLLTVGILTAVGLSIGAGIASAHVTVNPNTAVAGSYTKLTFRVPNESAKASTVKLTVNFPMDHPFASVSIKKQPGWTAKATTSKLSTPISDDDNATITQAVSSITWTADASGKIALGEFAEFDVSVGPVPKVPSMAFDAIQTYDDGSVVKWDQPTPASGVEPEYPAPVLTISAAAQTTPANPSAAATTAAVTASQEAATSSSTSDNTARILGVVGIIVGAIGLLVAALALRGRPRVKQ
jgi:periplasmic copper chaperone A